MISSFLILNSLYGIDAPLEVTVTPEYRQDEDVQYEPLKIISVVQSAEYTQHKLMSEVIQDLDLSGQLKIIPRSIALPKTKQDMTALYKKGYAYAFFWSINELDQTIELRCYDTLEGVMVLGKKWPIILEDLLWNAHMIAQDIWLALLQNKGSFCSRIAYVKKDGIRRRSQATSLWTTDLRGKEHTCIVRKKTYMIAPAWKLQGDKPVLFFSEFTDRNVSLRATTLKGAQWTVLDLDGTSVGVSSVSENLPVIYCRSGALWSYEYNGATKKAHHSRIVKEKEPCACPAQTETGDVIYCVQGRLKRWRAQTGISEMLPTRGYCTAPTYHVLSRNIAYSQMVNGTLQLMILELATGKIRQLTFDNGDKIDPTWSPCGTYIAFCRDEKTKSSIYSINVLDGSLIQLTSDEDYCTSPSWSPSIK